MGAADAAWEFRNPVRVIFGAGSLQRLPEVVTGRVLVVTTPGTTRRGLAGRVGELLGSGRALVHDAVRPNPTLDQVEASIGRLRGEAVDTVIGLGGGSALDTAKVLSLALPQPDFSLAAWLAEPRRYDATEPLPLVAIPTTAGTGSEATPFATLWDGAARRKLSVTTPRLYPDVAVVDPQLAVSLSWEATLGPGLDAYSQCLESIWNRNATPPATALALQGLELAPDALRTLRSQRDSLAARTDLAAAALLSGLAISQTRTGLAHSMSYPMTAHLGLPHGLACAMALPAVLDFNAALSAERRHGVPAGLPDGATTRALFEELGLRDAVAAHLPAPVDLVSLALEMLTPGRADNNLREADVDDVRGLLVTTAAWLWPEVTAS